MFALQALNKELSRRAQNLTRCTIQCVASPILLYDGVCAFCNRLVRFILRQDRQAIFRFASLQSSRSARILARHGANAANLDAVYVVVNPDELDESLLSRSDAILYVLQQLGGIWRVAALLLRLVPHPIRNWAYGIAARNRYRFFGRYETCPLPDEPVRSRFVDL
jgi:predicted DCC family thiol-disulfide oxidoreductase YuxK